MPQDSRPGHSEIKDPIASGRIELTPEELAEPKRHINLRLTVIARLVRSIFDRDVSVLGVTRSQWTMIAVVSRLPGCTQRTIADALETSEASAGRLIDRLCADGLLERRARHDDRRARAVYPTAAAEPLMENLSTIASHTEKRMFKGFSDEELEALQGYLDRVYDNVSRG